MRHAVSFGVLGCVAWLGGGCGGGEAALEIADTAMTGGAASTETTGPLYGSEGCGKSGQGIPDTIDVDGQERTFVLDVPDAYDPTRAYPLVTAWHGLGGDGALARSYFGIRDQVGDDAIVVYPDGLYAHGGTGWDLTADGRDAAFFDALTERLFAELCIDEERVFATGHSYGGYMSNLLGCARADVLAAIAPVAGGPTWWAGCNDKVAAWVTHGSGDTVVDLSEGEATRDQWVNTNACDTSAAPTDPDPCVAFEGCARDTHWCLHDGGHEWPSFAAGAIWQFFEAQ